MTTNILKGLYIHKSSGKKYNVIGIGRSVDCPYKTVVIYEQLYDGHMRGTNIELPVGSLWVRDLNEFNTARFIKVDE